MTWQAWPHSDAISKMPSAHTDLWPKWGCAEWTLPSCIVGSWPSVLFWRNGVGFTLRVHLLVVAGHQVSPAKVSATVFRGRVLVCLTWLCHICNGRRHGHSLHLVQSGLWGVKSCHCSGHFLFFHFMLYISDFRWGIKRFYIQRAWYF